MAQSEDPVTLDGFSTVQALRRARTAPPAGSEGAAAPQPEQNANQPVHPQPQVRIRHTIMPARHTIRCFHCSFQFVNTGRLDKVLCPKCRMFLSTEPQTIDGIWSGRVQTLGTITVAGGGDVKSGELAAMDLLLYGRVSGGRVDVMRRLELFPGSSLDLVTFRYADLLVHHGMTLAPSDAIKCSTLTVAGEVEAKVECTGCVTITATGTFRGSIRAPSMIIEDGATVEADVAVGTDAALPASAA